MSISTTSHKMENPLDDLNCRDKDLHEIFKVLSLRDRSLFPPRINLPVFFGLASLAFSLWLGYLLNFVGLISTLLAILFSAVVAILIYQTNTTPNTWCEWMDRLLSAYKPIDEVAFQELQKSVLNKGVFDFSDVKCWSLKEKQSLALAKRKLIENVQNLKFIDSDSET